MAEPARRRLSYAEYLRLERETDVRHGFLDGQVFAMAGGTPRHSAVRSNLTGALGMALRGSGPGGRVDLVDLGLALAVDDLYLDLPETGEGDHLTSKISV